jgi:hypothetical protein
MHVEDGTECENLKKSVVAATFEKALTYETAGPWFGTSNPQANRL